MSTKLKALGLGLFAMAAMGAFGVMNAGAEGGGVFDVGAGGVTITANEERGTEHNLEFTADTGGEFDCENAAFHGTAVEGEQASITVTPAWSECFTTGSTTKFDVVENGCTLEFTVGKLSTADNTVHVCGNETGPIEIKHPNCLITVAKQTVGDDTHVFDTHPDVPTPEGVSYDPDTKDGKHSITLTSTALVETQYHGGICQILGTNHEATMEGSATVWAENGAGQTVDLTATGTDDPADEYDE